MGITLSAIVPAFNEEPIIMTALTRLSAQLRDLAPLIGSYEIIVVDDGSTDKTASLVAQAAQRDPHIRLARLEKNQGVGMAILAGLREAQKSWVTVSCADAPFDMSDLKNFAADFDAHDLIVVARADLHAHSDYRKILSRVNGFLIRRIFNSSIRDFQFVQFYRRELLEKMTVISRGTMVPPELILRCIKAGARWKQITLPHHKRPGGIAKYGHPKHVFRTLLDMARLRINL